MSKLNEELMDTALDAKDGEIAIVNAVPPTYANAIEVHKKKKKEAEDALKHNAENVSLKQAKMPSTPEMKKLHLSESLFAEDAAVATKPHTNVYQNYKYADDADEDLWEKVYNELDASLDPQDCHREVKARHGARYQNVATDVDGNIVVFGRDEEHLELAKRVAEHYGVEYRISSNDNGSSEQLYKVKMTIIIPEE